MPVRFHAGKHIWILLIREEVILEGRQHGIWGQAGLGPLDSSAFSLLCGFGQNAFGLAFTEWELSNFQGCNEDEISSVCIGLDQGTWRMTSPQLMEVIINHLELLLRALGRKCRGLETGRLDLILLLISCVVLGKLQTPWVSSSTPFIS